MPPKKTAASRRRNAQTSSSDSDSDTMGSDPSSLGIDLPQFPSSTGASGESSTTRRRNNSDVFLEPDDTEDDDFGPITLKVPVEPNSDHTGFRVVHRPVNPPNEQNYKKRFMWKMLVALLLSFILWIVENVIIHYNLHRKFTKLFKKNDDDVVNTEIN